MDNFTRLFNDHSKKGRFDPQINSNLEFIKQSVTPLLSFHHTEAKILKERLAYLNNDAASLKIKSFSCSRIGLLPENNVIVAVLMNTGELFLLGKRKKGIFYKYRIV